MIAIRTDRHDVAAACHLLAIDDVAVGAEGDEQTTEVMEINRTLRAPTLMHLFDCQMVDPIR